MGRGRKKRDWGVGGGGGSLEEKVGSKGRTGRVGGGSIGWEGCLHDYTL